MTSYTDLKNNINIYLILNVGRCNPKENKKMIKTLNKKIKNNDELTDFEYECATEWNLWV